MVLQLVVNQVVTSKILKLTFSFHVIFSLVLHLFNLSNQVVFSAWLKRQDKKLNIL